MQAAKRFINKDGQVAILDATNVTAERRGRIRALLNDHPCFSSNASMTMKIS